MKENVLKLEWDKDDTTVKLIRFESEVFTFNVHK